MNSKSLLVRGARQNNLKNITVRIPHQALTVITGPSGAGKSSLAFDTIFAEGQRLYIESLSTYARQFLEKVNRPDVDTIENICPTIAIEQKNTVKNSRATVATTTELYDYLRLLFSKIGTVFCPTCQSPIQKGSISSIVDTVFKKCDGQKILIIAPFKSSPTSQKNSLRALLKKGFTRILLNNALYELTPASLSIPDQKEIWVVLDRQRVSPKIKKELTDSLEIAYQETHGRAIIQDETGKLHKFSLDRICSQCDYRFADTLPAFFSFNHPYGACEDCKGFGNHLSVDEEKVILNQNASLEEGAIDPWTKPSHHKWQQRLLEFAQEQKIPIDIPFKKLSPEAKKQIFEGTRSFKGILGFFKKLEEKKYKMGIRVFLSRYKSAFICTTCQGKRLRKETAFVRLHGKSIADLHAMTIEESKLFFSRLKLSKYEKTVSEEILKQIKSRLSFLDKVGVNYLTLNRLTKTLSGGEAQRINLGSQLGAQLMQTIYVLDEPSIGLHPRDNQRLIGILKNLRDQGNSVIVVEHDPEIIRAANHIVELGPQGGDLGGELIYDGPYTSFLKHPTLTASYLEGRATIALPVKRRTGPTEMLKLSEVTHHNLKSIDVEIPLHRFVCVTGLSGSGKSSLIHDTLYSALCRIFKIRHDRMGKFKTISGFKHIRTVRLLDQKPIGKSPRSNPISTLKGYDDIRKAFSSTLEAKKRGYTPSTFSFNTVGGRCEECRGEGIQRIEMHFLADIELTCETCSGKRFKKEVLEVTYKGKNIFDALSMTVDEATDFFVAYLGLRQKLKILQEVGLGYLKIGQPAPTLSGGEAQRLKIAKELSYQMTHTLYILDEPTTGLHLDDVKKLIEVLNRLVDQKNSVIVIEHHLDVIKQADYVIDLGPEGGHRGGEIVAQGTPEEVAKVKASYTGQFLKPYLH